MSESLRFLGDIFKQGKFKNVKDNKRGAYTNNQVQKVLSGEILDPKLEEHKPKDNTAINLSIKTLFEKQGLKIDDFEEKKVLDIGGGFTGLPFLLKNINSEVIVVDPIFSNNVFLEIKRNRDKIMDLVGEFDTKNYQAYMRGKKQNYFYSLNNEFNNILNDLSSWEKIDNLGNFSSGKTNVQVLANTFEDVDGISEESIDFIFINHTITKIQVDPHSMLYKAYNLLKKGGKIYITESGDIDYSNFEFFNEDFDIKIIKFDNFGVNEKSVLILEKL